ncbi:hypothetical protein NA57DRAFT_77454 [Rhizodiscina lignyota]|uniref:Uncharacterized protein n=1 Tax=Rhizodiscina lignyota TaxID=1504668 RepID=A0A9P4IFD5_9PEZI|nr:hypothetical protein NA57DRAFT_77454 [Rhizodiscina lignyota]
MSAAPTFSTNDLRSASIDYKRDHEQKKWAHGVAFGPGRLPDQHGRPVKLGQRAASPKRSKRPALKSAQVQEIVSGTDYASQSDSSVDEDIVEASAAPTPSSEIFYSYDSQKGPNHGSQILNAALAKAVERFESNMTDKIVKDEYDVLDHNGESVAAKAVRGRKGKKGDEVAVPAIAEDADYEFV